MDLCVCVCVCVCVFLGGVGGLACFQKGVYLISKKYKVFDLILL